MTSMRTRGREPFEIAGTEVPVGAARRIEIPVARLVTQTQVSLPVTVMHGREEGPRLWLSAAIHGDELNGMEIVRRVLAALDVDSLRGTLVAVPIVNLFGFLTQSRYLPDRRDLNRSFPGSLRGSLASRVAALFMTEIVLRCTHGLDFHTGSNHRSNLPHVRGNLETDAVRGLALAFGAPYALSSREIAGSLRHAAGEHGIPMLVYEAGEPSRFDESAIRVGVTGTLRTMAHLGMIDAPQPPAPSPPVRVVTSSTWVRAPRGGILHLNVELGAAVEASEVVALLRDAFGDTVARVRAPRAGVVLGMTNLPLVHKGEATIHLADVAV